MNGYMEPMLEEFIDHLEAKGSSPRTVYEYRHAMREFQEWLLVNEQEISAHVIDKFLVAMRGGWQPSYRIAYYKERNRVPRSRGEATIAKYARSLRRILKFASDRGFIDPITVTIPPVDETEERRYLTFEQVELIDEYLTGDLKILRSVTDVVAEAKISGAKVLDDYKFVKSRSYTKNLQKAIRFWLILETGMRSGEALELTWGNINLEEGTVFIRAAKTKYNRRVPIHTLWGKLPKLLEGVLTKEGKVLHGRNPDDEITYEGLVKFYDRLNRAVDLGTELNGEGIPHEITFNRHDLRRTFATLAFQKGIPANVIQKQLGHTSLETTQIYDKTKAEDMVKIFKNNL